MLAKSDLGDLHRRKSVLQMADPSSGIPAPVTCSYSNYVFLGFRGDPVCFLGQPICRAIRMPRSSLASLSASLRTLAAYATGSIFLLLHVSQHDTHSPTRVSKTSQESVPVIDTLPSALSTIRALPMPTKISLLTAGPPVEVDASRIRRALLCVLLAFSLLATATAPSIAPADPARYLNDIKTLAAPDMEGRGAGTKGLGRATKYIEHRYKSLGLQPAGTNGYLAALHRDHRREAKVAQPIHRRRRRQETVADVEPGFRAVQFLFLGIANRSGGLCRATARRPMNLDTTTTPAST